jgi:hypothetical protein
MRSAPPRWCAGTDSSARCRSSTPACRRRRLAGEAWQWYGPEIEETLVGQRARLVFIDGPPGSLQPLARYPARRRLAPFLADDAVLVLDDVARPDEWAITERWLRDDPRLTLQRIAHEKGTAILARSR